MSCVEGVKQILPHFFLVNTIISVSTPGAGLLLRIKLGDDVTSAIFPRQGIFKTRKRSREDVSRAFGYDIQKRRVEAPAAIETSR